MNNKKTIIAALFLVLGFALTAYVFSGTVSRKTIEFDAVKNQNVPGHYLVQKAESKDMVAILFYAPDKSDHIFSIYIRDNKLFNRYRFIYGGSLSAVQENVMVYKNGSNTAVLSMNSCDIAITEPSNDQFIFEIPGLPFVHIIEINGSVTFYDINNNEIFPNYPD